MLEQRTGVVLFIITLQLFEFCASLKYGDTGVCEETVLALKQEKKELKLVCCSNYEYDDEEDKCLPTCNDPFNCSPICDHACVNSTCVEHNKCLCAPGHERTKDYWICKPTCTGCQYGDCVAPYNCVCFNGYEHIDSTCKPKCSSCSNGDCVAPEVCQCHEGYKLVNGHCTPICSPPCVNGKCLSPNNCSCNNGYHSREFGVCEPYCSKTCINGHCTAPDFCTCNDGYVRDKSDFSRCVKPCIRPCKNGTCSSWTGECLCPSDFEYDYDTESCISMKPVPCEECAGKCDNVMNECRCLNSRPCFVKPVNVEIPAEAKASSAKQVKMAGMNMTLMAIGGACLLLLILVVVVIQKLWYRKIDYVINEDAGLGSVVYTVPNTLINRKASDGPMYEDFSEEVEATIVRLLGDYHTAPRTAAVGGEADLMSH